MNKHNTDIDAARTRIFLVHSTQYDRETGKLTELGEDQVQDVGALMARHIEDGEKIIVVYSEMVRAQQAAKFFANKFRVPSIEEHLCLNPINMYADEAERLVRALSSEADVVIVVTHESVMKALIPRLSLWLWGKPESGENVYHGILFAKEELGLKPLYI